MINDDTSLLSPALLLFLSSLSLSWKLSSIASRSWHWPRAGADTLQRLSADNAASKRSRGQQQDHHGIITIISIFTLSYVIRLLASGLLTLSSVPKIPNLGGRGVREGFGKRPNFYRFFLRNLSLPLVSYHIWQANPLPSGRYGLRGITLASLFHVTGPDHHDYPDE